MKKQLITNEFVFKNFFYFSKSLVIIISIIGAFLLMLATFGLLVNGFNFPIDSFVICISAIVGFCFGGIFFILGIIKHKKVTKYGEEYFIIEDILLNIKIIYTPTNDKGWVKQSLNRVKEYILVFSKIGDYSLPSKEYNSHYFPDCSIYDFAKREDRFYIIINSQGDAQGVLDTRLFDISTDDFKLIENKYYPKKDIQ